MSTPSNGSVAQKAAGSVLITLCAAQFLMALDSSVMNVSIATVAEDLGNDDHGHPDRHRAVHACHGDADGDGREDRVDHRAQASVRDRVRHLLLRVADHLAVAQPQLAHLRLVLPRRGRCRVDHARHRGARRRQLPGRRPAARIRARRCGRRDRRRRWPADRWARHHLRVVALGVRRRGARRGGHPPAGAQGCRRTRRRPATARLGGFVVLGWRHGLGHHRGASFVRLGMDPAGRRRPVDPWDVAGGVVRARRARADVALPDNTSDVGRRPGTIRSSARSCSPTRR